MAITHGHRLHVSLCIPIRCPIDARTGGAAAPYRMTATAAALPLPRADTTAQFVDPVQHNARRAGAAPRSGTPGACAPPPCRAVRQQTQGEVTSSVGRRQPAQAPHRQRPLHHQRRTRGGAIENPQTSPRGRPKQTHERAWCTLLVCATLVAWGLVTSTWPTWPCAKCMCRGRL